MIHRLASVVWFAALATALLASADPAIAAGISLGKIVIDPSPSSVVAAGVPVQFTITGSFKPPEKDEEPWIRFVWNFGDGTPVEQSAMLFGAGPQTHTITHTFANGGAFDVTVTGGHGFDFFGFKFFRDKTETVQVACAGADPGPKKCAKGAFGPFAGVWNAEAGGALQGSALTLEQIGDKVLGFLEYDGLRGIKVTLPIEGKMKYAVENDVESLIVKFKAKHTIETAKGKTKGRLVMRIPEDFVIAYRDVGLELTAAPALAATPGPSNVGSVGYRLKEPSDDTTATLCATIGAGKKIAKPGQLLVFAVDVQNEGAASLPAFRTAMDLLVAGGTLESSPLLDRAELRDTATATSLKLRLAPLGAGKGQKNARAQALFVVRPAPGATQVTVDASVFDADPASDVPFLVAPPPLRRLCVPVVPD